MGDSRLVVVFADALYKRKHIWPGLALRILCLNFTYSVENQADIQPRHHINWSHRLWLTLTG